MNQTGGRPAKTSWLPCVRCGDPDGPLAGSARTPTRISGARFGVAGMVCKRCYSQLDAGGRSSSGAQLREMAVAVLAARDALARQDIAGANRYFNRAVEMAELALSPVGDGVLLCQGQEGAGQAMNTTAKGRVRRCAAIACREDAVEDIGFCPPHWSMLPGTLQADLGRLGPKDGQPFDAWFTWRYQAARRRAMDAIAVREGRR